MADTNKTWIVVWDPEAEYWSGGLVDLVKAHQLAQRGVVLLPVEPPLFKLSGVGGYHYRAWGGGYPLDNPMPRMTCPLSMYCSREYPVFHWKARLVAEPNVADDVASFEGALRLQSDIGQVNPLKVGLMPLAKADPLFDMRQIGKADQYGGWTIGGKATAQVPQDGIYGFGLYGGAPGLRVVWAAVSLARFE